MFEYVDARIGDVMLTRANLDKFKQHGWDSKVNLFEGLKNIYRTLAKEVGPQGLIIKKEKDNHEEK